MDMEWSTLQELKAMQKEIQKEIDEAVAFAKSEPEPPKEELFDDVYSEPEALRGTLLTNGNGKGWLAQL